MSNFKSKKELDSYFQRHLGYINKSINECAFELERTEGLQGIGEASSSGEGYIGPVGQSWQYTAMKPTPPIWAVHKCNERERVLMELPLAGSWSKSYLQEQYQEELKKHGWDKNNGKGGGGGGGGGGSAKGGKQKPAEPKKDPPPPDTSPKLVSFGKMFLSFCLPSLTVIAKEQGVDDVQVNFYQINESCGPISLHSIAEFPVEISYAEQVFADFCMKRGGESMSVLDFINWASGAIFNDQRAVGYGMRSIIEPKKDPTPDNAEKSDAKPDDKKVPMTEWFEKYGEFKPPILTMKMETYYEGDTNKLDLLYKLNHRVGARYNPPPERFRLDDPTRKDKRILRIDIYDRSYNPFSKQSKLFKDKEGNYKVFETDVTNDEKKAFINSYARQYAGPGGSEIGIQTNVGSTQNITIDGVVVGKTIAKGANVLRDFIGETVSTIVVGGTNSTMVYNAQVQSKTDGLSATIALTGGSFKANSTVTPNSLSMAENNLPIRALPIEVSLTTIGCPIANVFQEYFLDFETGTTIDNLYKTTQIQHNFQPGKFETAWTFKYTDGYGKFFGATSINDELRAMGIDTKQKEEALEVADQAQLQEISVEETPVNNAKTTK